MLIVSLNYKKKFYETFKNKIPASYLILIIPPSIYDKTIKKNCFILNNYYHYLTFK